MGRLDFEGPAIGRLGGLETSQTAEDITEIIVGIDEIGPHRQRLTQVADGGLAFSGLKGSDAGEIQGIGVAGVGIEETAAQGHGGIRQAAL